MPEQLHAWDQAAQNVALNIGPQATSAVAAIVGGGPAPGAAQMPKAQEAEYYRQTLQGNNPGESVEQLTQRVGPVKVAQMQKQLGVNQVVAQAPPVPTGGPNG